jgi:hypothetical protein
LAAGPDTARLTPPSLPSPPQAAHVYRRDGWPLLLLDALLRLRDCCARLRLPREELLHRLEIASLSGPGLRQAGAGRQPADLADAADALHSLLAGASDRRASIMRPPSPPAGAGDGGGHQQQQQQQGGQGGAAPPLAYTVEHLDPAALARLAATPREDGSKPHVADILVQ